MVDGTDSASTHAPPVTQGRLVDWEMLYTGVVLPVICFAISFPEQPEWQSGEFSAYAKLLLAHLPSLPLYPLLLYCMACLVLLFRRPDHYGDHAVVRFGVYSGVLVAAEYCLVFHCALLGFDKNLVSWQFSATAIGVMLVLALRWSRKFLSGRSAVAAFLAALLLLAAVLTLPFWAYGSLLCAPLWALATYAIVSVRLIRQYMQRPLRFDLWQLFGGVSWLAAHLAAWRLAYQLMLAEYARLPITHPGGCFVCTAAANGYTPLVRSEPYRPPRGAVCRVNHQLRTLKAFELLLLSASPRWHRRCRRVYDAVGPLLAASLCHPLLATVAYFALKPLEYLATLCLAVVLRGDLAPVRSIYRSRG